MLHIQAPVMLKIRDGITVNLAQSFSQAVEVQATQKRLKKEFDTNGKKSPTEDDYEEFKADTLSFWFTDGRSLAYRVGHEITQEDFNRVKSNMESLEFRTNDRKSSDNKTSK